MTRLSAADQTIVERVLADIETAVGARTASVSLCGEAACQDYRADRSALGIVIVVDHIDMGVLDALKPPVRHWRARRVATPLLFDTEYLRHALDVFPLEILDILDRHVCLRGEPDPFGAVTLERRHVRHELEEQLRGKMLHLWESYLELASPRHLGRTILDSLPYLFVLLRGVAFLHRVERPGESMALLRTIESACGVSLAGVTRLFALRQEGAAISTRDLRDAIGGYLDDVRALVAVVDASER